MPACIAQKNTRRMLCASTEKHYYLNIAKTTESQRANRVSEDGRVLCCDGHATWMQPLVQAYRTPTATQLDGQAVRSLGPLRCACYQASTRGLSTSSSGWDLDCLLQGSGKTHLGCGFALRCFQRLSLLDVAIQLWPRQANWLTSGPAISVLSYWR